MKTFKELNEARASKFKIEDIVDTIVDVINPSTSISFMTALSKFSSKYATAKDVEWNIVNKILTGMKVNSSKISSILIKVSK